MNPMNTFNPDVPCHVHDGLNRQTIEWKPQWAPLYREYAVKCDEGVIAWDGLLLDGWTAILHSHPAVHSVKSASVVGRRLMAVYVAKRSDCGDGSAG